MDNYYYILLILIILDEVMILIGYLGIINYINKIYSLILGFISLIIIFFIIYFKFNIKNNYYKQIIFYSYLFIWSCYGIIYILDNNKYRIIINNILDMIAKSFIGIIIIYYCIIKNNITPTKKKNEIKRSYDLYIL
jgi:hypothetical protein